MEASKCSNRSPGRWSSALPDRSSVCSEVRPSKSDLRSAPMPSPDRSSDPMALTCASVTAAAGARRGHLPHDGVAHRGLTIAHPARQARGVAVDLPGRSHRVVVPRRGNAVLRRDDGPATAEPNRALPTTGEADTQPVDVDVARTHRQAEDQLAGMVHAEKVRLPGNNSRICFVHRDVGVHIGAVAPGILHLHRLVEGEGDLDPLARLEGVAAVGRARGHAHIGRCPARP